MSNNISFQGYARQDGRKGIRNVIVIAYLVECAHHVTRGIVTLADDTDVHLIGFPGCYPNQYAYEMMRAVSTHPNVGGALLISLGCESMNRDKLLKEIPGIKVNLPEGAFYFFPDVSAYYGKSDGTMTIKNGDDFCLYMLEKAHVSLVTGDAFGDPKCIRLSYAASEKDLREAVTRIKDALAKLK